MQIKAGLRVAVQPHGGHFWSSMGQVQRPMDIVSLRIDNQVRASITVADTFPGLLDSWVPSHLQAHTCICRASCQNVLLSRTIPQTRHCYCIRYV